MTTEERDEPGAARSDGLPGVLQRLDDLDRRVVPTAAARLDKLLVAAGSRLELAPRNRRILGALALVLLGCAAALVVIGG